MKILSLEILFITLLCIFNVNARSILNSEVLFDDGKDIDYGTRKLDVYFDRFTTDQLKPVIIFVHGGGWFSGSKEEYKNLGEVLERNGYVGVLPGYVLFPHGKLEDMINDIYHSFRWVYDNIEKYGGDPNNITVCGHSAGSHLAAITIFKAAFGLPNYNEPLQPLSFVKKMILFNGPYNFDDYSVLKQLFKIEIENGISEQVMTFLFGTDNISPTDIINKFDDHSIDDSVLPKFVIIHTSHDLIVPISSSEGLVKELKRAIKNPDVKYELLKGYGHATIFDGIIKKNEEKYKVILSGLINKYL